jgi:hypothetical protein
VWLPEPLKSCHAGIPVTSALLCGRTIPLLGRTQYFLGDVVLTYDTKTGGMSCAFPKNMSYFLQNMEGHFNGKATRGTVGQVIMKLSTQDKIYKNYMAIIMNLLFQLHLLKPNISKGPLSPIHVDNVESNLM